jgi:hypothetical protein
VPTGNRARDEAVSIQDKKEMRDGKEIRIVDRVAGGRPDGAA